MDFRYVGWDKIYNYGDFFGKKLIADMGFKFTENGDNLFIGAGSLLPINDWLKELIIKTEPKETIAFGTGCEDPTFLNEEKKQIFDYYMDYTRNLLKNSKFIGLRDEFSKATLGMGETIGDPFFCLNSPPPTIQKEKYIVLNIGHSFFGRGAPRVWGQLDGQMDSFKNILKFTKKIVINKLKLKVKILPLGGYDYPFTDIAAFYLSFMPTLPKSLIQTLDLFKNAEFCITYRLHGMITSLVTNTPTIPIEYRPKVRNVAKDFKIDKFILRTSEVTEDSLYEKYRLLPEWDKEFVSKKKAEYKLKIQNFVKRIQNHYI